MASVVGKKFVLRFRAVNRDIFEAIKDGRKKVETRAATSKYRDLKAGDRLVLACGRDRFEKTVKRAKIFLSIHALLRAYKVKEINPLVATAVELREVYFSFPGYRAKIAANGLIALELK